MTIEQGGKAIYGASVGISMLEARFPRIPGDIGNALTWPFPVQYRVIANASPDRVVRRGAEGVKEAFTAAAQDLVASGVDGITTNCGFLSLIQEDAAAAVSVPVATSALMQVPMVEALLPPGRRVGVLTISEATLTADHLNAAGVSLDTPVVGTDDGREFTRAILDDHAEIDFAACRQDLLDAAETLITKHDRIGAIVLECTNMVPYAADIRKRTGLPVYSMYSFVTWFQSGLMPRRFSLDFDDVRIDLKNGDS